MPKSCSWVTVATLHGAADRLLIWRFLAVVRLRSGSPHVSPSSPLALSELSLVWLTLFLHDLSTHPYYVSLTRKC